MNQAKDLSPLVLCPSLAPDLDDYLATVPPPCQHSVVTGWRTHTAPTSVPHTHSLDFVSTLSSPLQRELSGGTTCTSPLPPLHHKDSSLFSFLVQKDGGSVPPPLAPGLASKRTRFPSPNLLPATGNAKQYVKKSGDAARPPRADQSPTKPVAAPQKQTDASVVRAHAFADQASAQANELAPSHSTAVATSTVLAASPPTQLHAGADSTVTPGVHARHHTAGFGTGVKKPRPAACKSNKRRDGGKPASSMQAAPVHQGPVRRCITNATYLRRLHLSPQQAAWLVPDLSTQLLHVASLRRRHRTRANFTGLRQDVTLVDADGRPWSATLECSPTCGGQLHCRLVSGWSHFCDDHCVCVFDTVVLDRVDGHPDGAAVAVRVERRQSDGQDAG